MLWLLETLAHATRDVSITINITAISPLLLVVLHEALDHPALVEVVPVGSMDLAPLASSLLLRGQLLGAPAGFLPIGGLLRPSVARAAIAFRLFFLLPGLLHSGEVGSAAVCRSVQL
jgi:hypothetical protein